MRRSAFSKFAVLFARLFLGGVFAYAGLMKLLEPAANFEAALEQYPLIPPGLLPFLARLLPWAEWILGMLVLLGYGLRVCALTLSLVSLSFIGVLMASLSGGHVLNQCGCFGSSGLSLSGSEVFLVDWLNVILGGYLFWRHETFLSVDELIAKRVSAKPPHDRRSL